MVQVGREGEKCTFELPKLFILLLLLLVIAVVFKTNKIISVSSVVFINFTFMLIQIKFSV